MDDLVILILISEAKHFFELQTFTSLELKMYITNSVHVWTRNIMGMKQYVSESF
jgi:hypothetical protein